MLSRKERKRLRLEKLRKESDESRKEYEAHQERFSQEKTSHGSRKKILLFSGTALAVVLIAGYAVYAAASPGRFDSFAECLKEKGAVMYGAMSWCQYTQAQRAMFGKSFKYVNYHEYQDLPGIKKTPTWVINGAWHENVQSFDRLSALTGCKL